MFNLSKLEVEYDNCSTDITVPFSVIINGKLIEDVCTFHYNGSNRDMYVDVEKLSYSESVMLYEKLENYLIDNPSINTEINSNVYG